MRGTDHKQSPLFSYVNLEDRIPRDHPLRRVKVLADMVLRSMSAHFDALYAEGGRPSLAPERLLRASLLQCLVSIRSERALVEHIDFNLMYRWFVGLTLDEAIWDHSTFSANRERLLKESVMREFFGGVAAIAEWAQLVSDEHFSVDGQFVGALIRWRSRAIRIAARGGKRCLCSDRSAAELQEQNRRKTDEKPLHGAQRRTFSEPILPSPAGNRR